MIYVTGDTHGDIERFHERKIRRLKKQDTLIVLGDFGFVWDGGDAEMKNLQWLKKRRYQILFIDGCHDNYDMLKEYPEVEYMGGRARQLGENLYYILRGSVLEIEEKKLLCFGGGETQDKEDREQGVNWWPDELPTEKEMAWCTQNLARCGNEVDYVLTHDAPTRLLDFTALEAHQTNWLHLFLDKLLGMVTYKKWLFGCYHKDMMLSSKAQAVFCDVLPLE